VLQAARDPVATTGRTAGYSQPFRLKNRYGSAAESTRASRKDPSRLWWQAPIRSEASALPHKRARSRRSGYGQSRSSVGHD
jgi:hypothetical protein